MTEFKVCGEREHTTVNFSLSFLTRTLFLTIVRVVRVGIVTKYFKLYKFIFSSDAFVDRDSHVQYSPLVQVVKVKIQLARLVEVVIVILFLKIT